MQTVLNHINLTVADVTAAAALFLDVFGFTLISHRSHGFCILAGHDEFVLTLMKVGSEPPVYPQVFHLGFLQPDRKSVDGLHQRLVDFGLQLPEASLHRADSYGFYLDAPGGFQIEISTLAA